MQPRNANNTPSTHIIRNNANGHSLFNKGLTLRTGPYEIGYSLLQYNTAWTLETLQAPVLLLIWKLSIDNCQLN
jgi:hypothetical protein